VDVAAAAVAVADRGCLTSDNGATRGGANNGGSNATSRASAAERPRPAQEAAATPLGIVNVDVPRFAINFLPTESQAFLCVLGQWKAAPQHCFSRLVAFGIQCI
jgi:hypothetical protein